MVRSVLGVVAGAIVWMVRFYALAIVLAKLWRDYAIHESPVDKRGCVYILDPDQDVEHHRAAIVKIDFKRTQPRVVAGVHLERFQTRCAHGRRPRPPPLNP